MKKRWISLLAALALVAGVCMADPLAGLAASLEADQNGYVTGSCSLTVYPEDLNKAEEDSFGEDLINADVVVDLYQVARAVRTSGKDSYTFEVQPGYGFEIGDSPEWEALAQQAASVALGGAGMPATVTGASTGTKIPDLAPGLYLLIARGRDLTSPEDYKMEIKTKDPLTEEESIRIATIAESEQYIYAYLPRLVAVPTKAADADGVVRPDSPGDWIFDVTVNLKPERKPKEGALEIVKTLTEYETMGENREEATFVFEITAVLDGEVVYSNVESITFTGAGQQSVILEGIPAGAEVTVREVYSGASYQLTVPGDRVAVIEAQDIVSVEFENEYNGHRTNGHGIKNQFVYDEEAEAWHWYSSPAQDAAGNQGERQE